MSVVDVKRRKNESFEGLFRRFNKRVHDSGNRLEVGKHRYHTKDPNPARQKASAIRRMRFKERMEYLIKIGQMPETNRRRRRRR